MVARPLIIREVAGPDNHLRLSFPVASSLRDEDEAEPRVPLPVASVALSPARFDTFG